MLIIPKFYDSNISWSEQIRLPNQSQAEVAVAEFPYFPAHWITYSLFQAGTAPRITVQSKTSNILYQTLFQTSFNVVTVL